MLKKSPAAEKFEASLRKLREFFDRESSMRENEARSHEELVRSRAASDAEMIREGSRVIELEAKLEAQESLLRANRMSLDEERREKEALKREMQESGTKEDMLRKEYEAKLKAEAEISAQLRQELTAAKGAETSQEAPEEIERLQNEKARLRKAARDFKTKYETSKKNEETLRAASAAKLAEQLEAVQKQHQDTLAEAMQLLADEKEKTETLRVEVKETEAKLKTQKMNYEAQLIAAESSKNELELSAAEAIADAKRRDDDGLREQIKSAEIRCQAAETASNKLRAFLRDQKQKHEAALASRRDHEASLEARLEAAEATIVRLKTAQASTVKKRKKNLEEQVQEAEAASAALDQELAHENKRVKHSTLTQEEGSGAEVELADNEQSAQEEEEEDHQPPLQKSSSSESVLIIDDDEPMPTTVNAEDNLHEGPSIHMAQAESPAKHQDAALGIDDQEDAGEAPEDEDAVVEPPAVTHADIEDDDLEASPAPPATIPEEDQNEEEPVLATEVEENDDDDQEAAQIPPENTFEEDEDDAVLDEAPVVDEEHEAEEAAPLPESTDADADADADQDEEVVVAIDDDDDDDDDAPIQVEIVEEEEAEDEAVASPEEALDDEDDQEDEPILIEDDEEQDDAMSEAEPRIEENISEHQQQAMQAPDSMEGVEVDEEDDDEVLEERADQMDDDDDEVDDRMEEDDDAAADDQVQRDESGDVLVLDADAQDNEVVPIEE